MAYKDKYIAYFNFIFCLFLYDKFTFALSPFRIMIFILYKSQEIDDAFL